MGDSLGKMILKKYDNLDIDVVIPIPDTSRTAAMQVAYKLGVKVQRRLHEKQIHRTDIYNARTEYKKTLCQTEA